MRREFAAPDEDLVARLPINSGGDGGQAGARAAGYGDLIRPRADHARNFFTDSIGKIEVGGITQTVGTLLPFQRRLRFARGSQRHRPLQRRIQIRHTFEIREFTAIVRGQCPVLHSRTSVSV